MNIKLNNSRIRKALLGLAGVGLFIIGGIGVPFIFAVVATAEEETANLINHQSATYTHTPPAPTDQYSRELDIMQQLHDLGVNARDTPEIPLGMCPSKAYPPPMTNTWNGEIPRK